MTYVKSYEKKQDGVWGTLQLDCHFLIFSVFHLVKVTKGTYFVLKKVPSGLHCLFPTGMYLFYATRAPSTFIHSIFCF